LAAFEYRQAQEIRDCFQRRGVRYLFLDKSGAILLGFPDTTQDADLFVGSKERNFHSIFMVGKNVVAVMGSDDSVVTIDALHIAAIEDLPSPKRRK
jgi:hypothetical protein